MLDGTIYGGACEQINAVNVNGTVKWSYTHPNPEPQPWESQPAAIDQRGIVYFPTAGTVAALDPASGKVAWNYTMDTAYYGGGIVGCNCPPPFSLSRCAVACQLQG
jgi:outer membrane protein assembly factor BamB